MDIPQVPDEILHFLEKFRDGILECLGSTVIALYVYGSVVMGDFIPETSDIDFMVIVETLSQERGHCLEELHRTLVRTHKYGRILEGDYIPLSHITPQGGLKTHYGYEKGFCYTMPGDVISPDTLVTIRENSITLYGPPPDSIIPRVPDEVLKEYMVDLLKEYTEELKECDRDLLELASDVLNMLRSWHAALTGQIVSKSKAASVALTVLPPCWHPLVQSALTVRSGGLLEDENGTILKKDAQSLAEFLVREVT